jgi:4-carboxymuconolactone decarboxylase
MEKLSSATPSVTNVSLSTNSTMSESKAAQEAHRTLFEEGIKIRREVAGDEYVDAALKRFSSDFSKPLQSLLTELGWGWIWTRPGLDRKQRSLLNLGMLSALNKWTELGVHVRGALRNGLSEIEIREALLQVGGYCGLPAGESEPLLTRERCR